MQSGRLVYRLSLDSRDLQEDSLLNSLLIVLNEITSGFYLPQRLDQQVIPECQRRSCSMNPFLKKVCFCSSSLCPLTNVLSSFQSSSLLTFPFLRSRQQHKHRHIERRPSSRLEMRLKGTGMGSQVLYVCILIAFLIDHSFNEFSFKADKLCRTKNCHLVLSSTMA